MRILKWMHIVLAPIFALLSINSFLSGDFYVGFLELCVALSNVGYAIDAHETLKEAD